MARVEQASNVFDHLDDQGPDLWNVWRCRVCASLYPDPRPSGASIAEAYRNYYTHDAEPSAALSQGVRGLLMALVGGYMNRRFGGHMAPTNRLGFPLFSIVEPLRLKLDYHGRHLFLASQRRGRNVLDVGSGNGEFLRRASELGWTATGLDPDPGAVSTCTAQDLTAYQGFIGDTERLPPGRFDVITLRHSIEHVPSIQTDLGHCLRRLQPGGMIWLAWPNPRGLGARFFGPAWRGLEVPRHLCIPSADAMEAMLADAGFVGSRILRRGHHARSIVRESGRIARLRPGLANRLRAAIAPLIGLYADMVATFAPRGGEELVMVAFAPETHDRA
jgi:2-polyprenyl-3-methyl-5-hydroxy-6-metoxy-1,4-benzoquinol methylase